MDLKIKLDLISTYIKTYPFWSERTYKVDTCKFRCGHLTVGSFITCIWIKALHRHTRVRFRIWISLQLGNDSIFLNKGTLSLLLGRNPGPSCLLIVQREVINTLAMSNIRYAQLRKILSRNVKPVFPLNSDSYLLSLYYDLYYCVG